MTALRGSTRIALGLALSLWPAGCVSVEPGSTVITVHAADAAEEKAIRRQTWVVEKAVERVMVRYGLEDEFVQVIVADLGGLGQTTPDLDAHLDVAGATVVLNKRLLLEEHPDLEEITVGLMAHELAHALHYARMDRRDLVRLGMNYDAMMAHPEGEKRAWVRTYERLTDLTAIALGFGPELIHQKHASEENLARNHPPRVWDFYLKEAEIRAYLADRAALEHALEACSKELDLSSLERLCRTVLAAQGDLTPPRRRS